MEREICDANRRHIVIRLNSHIAGVPTFWSSHLLQRFLIEGYNDVPRKAAKVKQ